MFLCNILALQRRGCCGGAIGLSRNIPLVISMATVNAAINVKSDIYFFRRAYYGVKMQSRFSAWLKLSSLYCVWIRMCQSNIYIFLIYSKKIKFFHINVRKVEPLKSFTFSNIKFQTNFVLLLVFFSYYSPSTCSIVSAFLTSLRAFHIYLDLSFLWNKMFTK